MSNLVENTIAFQMTIHRWGIKRQVPQVVLEGLMPGERELIKKKMLSASKRIIESKEYDAIVSRDGYAARWLADHSVPSILKKGVYCIPTVIIQEVDEYIEGYKYERAHELVPRFLDTYSDQAYTARDMLGEALFSALEYPTIEKMSTLFSVDTSYITFDVPKSLKFVSDELFRRERERVQAAWAEAEQAIQQGLLAECIELVSGLQGALAGIGEQSVNGHAKKFREANIENLLEWSELFLRARNVTEHEGLQQVVEQIQLTLQGVSRKDLLHNAGNARVYVQQTMQGIQSDLKGMLEEIPERAIYFD